jgi:hypothetical protein
LNKKKDKKSGKFWVGYEIRSIELSFYVTLSGGIILFVVQPIKGKRLLMVVVLFEKPLMT